MTGILVLLAILVLPWCIARAVGASAPVRHRAGLAGIAALFVATGIGHFLVTDAMSRMIPPWLPWPRAAILASGALEIAAGLAVLAPRIRRPVGWSLIALLALLLPFNIHAAFARVEFGGHEQGPIYLLARVPLQLVMAWWIHRFAIRAPALDGGIDPDR